MFGLKCFVKKKVTVDVLNTICNSDCCADFNIDSFVLEYCIFGVSLKANNNITILKTELSTQCSNGCQCVLCNFQ